MNTGVSQRVLIRKKGGVREDSYAAVHMWLKTKFGKANKCEWKECKGRSKTFQWALIFGKKYEKKRENFFMLCSPCHCHYDRVLNK